MSAMLREQNSSNNSYSRQMKKDLLIRRHIMTELSRRKNINEYVDMQTKLRSVLYVTPEMHVVDAAKYMAATYTNCALVRDSNSNVVGIITSRDLVAAASNPSDQRVSMHMTKSDKIVYGNIHMDSITILNTMIEHKISKMPICDDNMDIVLILNIADCLSDVMNKSGMADQLDLEVDIDIDAATDKEDEFVLEFQNQSNPPLSDDCRFGVGVIDPKSTVLDAINLMTELDVSVLLVQKTNNGKNETQSTEISGIITSSDILLRVLAADINAQTCSIIRVMTPDPIIISNSRTGLKTVALKLCEHSKIPLTFTSTPSVTDIFGIASEILSRLDAATIEPDWDKFLLNDSTKALDEVHENELAQFDLDNLEYTPDSFLMKQAEVVEFQIHVQNTEVKHSAYRTTSANIIALKTYLSGLLNIEEELLEIAVINKDETSSFIVSDQDMQRYLDKGRKNGSPISLLVNKKPSVKVSVAPFVLGSVAGIATLLLIRYLNSKKR